jgi:crossover junction endodeoxyribonuclease RuvC
VKRCLLRILGIDPGYAIVGWGVLDYEKNKFYTVAYGAITTDAHTDFQARLVEIYDQVVKVIEMTSPTALAIEKLYYTTNQKTVIQVAQSRGVILLAAAKNNLPVYEYTPLQIKQSVTGYGKAVKKQMQAMTKTILKLESIPKPDDTADRLAVGICHAYSYKSKLFTQIGKNL